MITCLAQKLGRPPGTACAHRAATISNLTTHLVEVHRAESSAASRQARYFAELAARGLEADERTGVGLNAVKPRPAPRAGSGPVQPGLVQPGLVQPRPPDGPPGGYRGRAGERRCRLCREPGHYAPTCPSA